MSDTSLGVEGIGGVAAEVEVVVVVLVYLSECGEDTEYEIARDGNEAGTKSRRRMEVRQ